jgi:hypothetical protein
MYESIGLVVMTGRLVGEIERTIGLQLRGGWHDGKRKKRERVIMKDGRRVNGVEGRKM